MCPGLKAVEMFLADDGSLDPSMEAQLIGRSLGSQNVTKGTDASPLDSMNRGSSSDISSGLVSASMSSVSKLLPAELTLEGRAEKQASTKAAALREKMNAETMDALPTTLVITTAAEELGGKLVPTSCCSLSVPASMPYLYAVSGHCCACH